ncbi:hypothetical protein B0H63DRAFT_548822 [Podospora didyma]|uniref:Uncharacterized protein n=1 Tax=Podospora didyma TaxID=330526 RepID=A0AAE0KDL6_9PEZI|nr:hypothetical protein B0H63DRAFT_548822 [Podospora didyma]
MANSFDQPPPNTILPKLGLPLAIILGIALTAGTTYLVARHVIKLRAKATVDSNPATWKLKARQRVYDACYPGCNGDILADGVECSANKIWNWAERYPDICLAALGETYRVKDLEEERRKPLGRIALVILTVLVGVLDGSAVSWGWKRATARCARYEEATRERARQWPRMRDAAPWRITRRSRNPSNTASTSKRAKLKTLLAGLLASSRGAHAGEYFCNMVLLTNANETITAAVHGWTSVCVNWQECWTVPSWECDPLWNPLKDREQCQWYNREKCEWHWKVKSSPKDRVDGIMGSVKACGFHEVDTLKVPAKLRVAHPGIEKHSFVTIKAYQYPFLPY